MSTKKTKLLLGAHMSIAGGFDQAVERGNSIGCTAIQIFTRSNRQWKSKPITKDAVDSFKKALKKSGIQSVLVHMPYLMNIGSPDPKTRHASLAALKEEMHRCDLLGIKYLVLHPGSHLGGGQEACLDTIVSGLDKVITKENKAMILLENMAGQGTNVGYTFEQLGYIIKNVASPSRVGVCFDTCHAFAAGYDFTDKENYESMWKEFGKKIGLRKLKAIHLNDSMKELDSHVDRHQDIGKGKIGRQAFTLLMNDARFFAIPKVLETPKATLESYAKNMKLLKGLLTEKTKKMLLVD